MTSPPPFELPDGFTVASLERNAAGETNEVYFCRGTFAGRPVEAYVKVGKDPGSRLANERAVLERLASSGIPVPAVLWYGGTARDVLVLEALPGSMVWDYIDPRRALYEPSRALSYLRAYGACLGQIHALPVDWAPQRRPRLYQLIGEEGVEEVRFQRLVRWLQENRPTHEATTFVHGDLNTASVLFREGTATGVIDWEFAGSGWREYDLAWILRARTAFLNTPEERSAVLEGYLEHSPYDAAALRYCEVLNYLHFAYWDREHDPVYTAFALERARALAEW